jgi:hypothetical protein
MGVPEVDVDGVSSGGRGAPEFLGGEADGAEVLGDLAAAVAAGVGEDKDAVVAGDQAEAAAGVAGQTGVACG